MANFPASLDNASSLPNPSAANNTNSPSHAGLHAAENSAIIATETKLGTGATTPAANQLLVGTGAGTSAWQGLTSAQLAAILSDETGSGSAVFATTPTLITPKIDTINENTPANGVTIDGLNIKDNALNTSSSVPTAALQDSAVTSAKVATGMPVQIVQQTYTAVVTGTGTIPFDNTIPQNTEGTEFMSVSITPKSTTNRLNIEALCQLTAGTGNSWLQAALFQDSTANAIASMFFFQVTQHAAAILPVRHDMVAGTVSSTTFKIRAGMDVAGTTTFNGQNALQRHGGVSICSIKVTEYKA